MVCTAIKKHTTMKILLLMLTLSTGLFAQEQIFNVQQYSIDNKPFKTQGYDLTGNEYSFVFVDKSKNEVVLFLSDTQIKYSIEEVNKGTSSTPTTYKLRNAEGIVDMSIDKSKTKIEFLEPNRRISLKVGKSTKLN